MKHVFVTNEDVTQLILIPDNDTESLLLNKLLNNDELCITASREPISLPGLSSKVSITLTRSLNKSKTNDVTG